MSPTGEGSARWVWRGNPGFHQPLPFNGEMQVNHALGAASAEKGEAHKTDARQESRGQAPRQTRRPQVPQSRRQYVRGQALARSRSAWPLLRRCRLTAAVVRVSTPVAMALDLGIQRESTRRIERRKQFSNRLARQNSRVNVPMPDRVAPRVMGYPALSGGRRGVCIGRFHESQLVQTHCRLRKVSIEVRRQSCAQSVPLETLVGSSLRICAMPLADRLADVTHCRQRGASLGIEEQTPAVSVSKPGHRSGKPLPSRQSAAPGCGQVRVPCRLGIWL